ncbi:MAG: PQQ-binding-like beta-propeller repeat protein, partial [Gemmataceae bacterium]
MRTATPALLALILTLPALAADWPRFQGPGGLGVAAGTLPDSITAAHLRFQVSTDAGNGSPIVAHDRIYLQTAPTGTERFLVALELKSGKPIWSAPLAGGVGRTHKKNSLASGTPAADDDRIYVVSWNGTEQHLNAVTKAGKVAWTQKLGGFRSQHGAGHSPIVHAGMVYVNFDQDDSAELLAFDAATGKPKWKAPRKAFRSCYSTPFIRTPMNQPTEVVVSSTAGVAG